MYSFSRYKEQYRANLKLALPVVLSQVGQILVQFADNAMVGQFGGDDPLPLAAVSFGGAVFFILFVTGMGLTLGLTPLVGERFAQDDKRGAADYLKNAMIFYSVLGFLIAAVQLAVIPLMYRMGQPAEVVDLAIPYYRLMAFSMPAVMLFFAFKQFLEGVGNTVVSMVIVVGCNLMNVVLNWVFIFGHCGFEAMGATGAGVATLISPCRSSPFGISTAASVCASMPRCCPKCVTRAARCGSWCAWACRFRDRCSSKRRPSC